MRTRPETRHLTVRLELPELAALKALAKAQGRPTAALARERLLADQWLNVGPLEDAVAVARRRAATRQLMELERRALAAVATAIADILAGRQVKASVAALLAGPAAVNDAGPLVPAA